MSDLRYALRSLSRRPLVTAVAVLSLALGIGVNTAIFSVFDRLFLRRLAVPAADELVLVTSPGPRPGSRSTGDAGGVEAIFSYPLFRDLEALDTDALTIAGHRDFSANLAHRSQTSEGEGLLVSGRYFQVLGLTPALGRLLGPDDDRTPGGHPVVVLSHDYWTTRLGAGPDVLGSALTVNGEPMTIVGVGPAGFSGTTTLDRPQVFVPMAMAAQAFRNPGQVSARDNHWVYVFGRLDPGVSREQAEASITVPFAGLIRGVELEALRSGLSEPAREQFEQRQIVLEDGSRERNTGRGDIAPMLVLLFAVTGCVLAIACANVANLLLARAADRSKEIAVRLSMGASTGRLLRLLLLEACVLGLFGGIAALAVGKMTIDGLLALLPPGDGSMLDFGIDGTTLLFTLALGLCASLCVGLFPAVHGVRNAASGLQAQSIRTSGSRTANRFRTSMATAQIAMATALLALAGLLIVSLVNLGRLELGIRRDGLVAFRLAPHLNGYDAERARTFFDRLEDELQGLPEVVSVTASTVPILSNNAWGNNLTVEGFEAGPDADTTASWARVGVNYFRTLGIPVLAGREFSLADTDGAPSTAVVNEAFARKFNLGQDVIGRRMALGAGGNITLDIEIVGLVRDAKYSEVAVPVPPQFFLPYRQGGGVGSLTFYVRTTSDTRAIASAIPSVVGRLDADLPVGSLRTMDEQIWENTTPNRVLSTLSSAFAVVATLLAAIGLYAVLAYGVAQRTREFGIRIALGATGGTVRRLVLAQVGRIVLIGGTVGALLALGLGRLGQALLLGVNGSDATIIGGAVFVVLVVALGAGALPARRASLVNPVDALRAE